jgi:hypothetical protein
MYFAGLRGNDMAASQSLNKQLQRTVIRHRGAVASATSHYALAPHITRQRAGAELRRLAAINCEAAHASMYHDL